VTNGASERAQTTGPAVPAAGVHRVVALTSDRRCDAVVWQVDNRARVARSCTLQRAAARRPQRPWVAGSCVRLWVTGSLNHSKEVPLFVTRA